MLRFAVPVGAVLPLILLMTGSGMAGSTLVEGGQYPDLRAANPHHFTVQNNQQREFLRFSNMVANTGPGDLILRPEHDTVSNIKTGYQEIEDAAGNVIDEEAVSQFVFHPAHNHWHITAVALFEVRKALDDGRGGSWGEVYSNQSIKTTFCLIDVIQLDGQSKTPELRFWDCFPDERQGISSGWGDQYHHATEGQELEITGAPKDKIYYLVSTSNPDLAFIETDYGNNMAWTSFRLTRDSKGNAKITEVAAAPCTGKLCGVQIPNR
jgi:Lysyl oxidase